MVSITRDRLTVEVRRLRGKIIGIDFRVSPELQSHIHDVIDRAGSNYRYNDANTLIIEENKTSNYTDPRIRFQLNGRVHSDRDKYVAPEGVKMYTSSDLDDVARDAVKQYLQEQLDAIS